MTKEKAKEALLREIEQGLFDIDASDTVSISEIEEYDFKADKDIIDAIKKRKAKTCQAMLESWVHNKDKPKFQELAFRILADERNRVAMTGVATPMVDGEGADNELIIELVDSTSKIKKHDAKETESYIDDIDDDDEDEVEAPQPKKRGRKKKQ